MSTRAAKFDAEASRSLPRNTTQQQGSRSEGRLEGREERVSNRSRVGTIEAEPTEVNVSHKKAQGKTNENGGQSLKISKGRVHAAAATSGENSLKTPEYAPSAPYGSSRNTQDYSCKASSNPYTSMQKPDSERTKFMDNIPGISAATEQSSPGGDFISRTVFPPPSVGNYRQNVAYHSTPSSDIKPMPRDSNNTTDLILHKPSANRHTAEARGRIQAETEMQWNTSRENKYRLREEHKNRSVPSEFHHTRTRTGRRSKDGVSVVYSEAKFSGSNRANISRRSNPSSSYSESLTDSQGSSTESESSSDASIKRRRRIRRKPSNKSIGSSNYGEDNTSESENQSVSELSASDNAHSQSKRRTQCSLEEDDIRSVVALKEHRSGTLNKLRSSSLTSVSSLESTGISGDFSSRNQSPLLSPRGSSISKLKKIQIRSLTSFADSQIYNKENLPQRRRSTEERETFRMRPRIETAPKEKKSRSPVSRQGSESPSLSRNPFGLKSKNFVQKASKELLSSDSECNLASDKELISTQSTSDMFDEQVGQEQLKRESDPDVTFPTETSDSKLNLNIANELQGSSWNAFVPIQANSKTDLNVTLQDTFISDSNAEKSATSSGSVLVRPVARRDHSRPLSIVQETEEFADVSQKGDCYRNEHIETILRKSNVRTRETQQTPPPSSVENRSSSISSLRRLSYVKAQTNSSSFTFDSADETDHTFDESKSSGFLPLYSEDSSSRTYIMEVCNETRQALEEFDPKPIGTSQVNEMDLISFEDEKGGGIEPVKKRTKRITRPRIPTILGGEEDSGRKSNDADLQTLESKRNVDDENEVTLKKGTGNI